MRIFFFRIYINCLKCLASARSVALSKPDTHSSGADPGFQVRGGALKKIAPSGGRRENFWGNSCEKSRFYAKKIIFFPILGGTPPPPESAPAHGPRSDFPYCSPTLLPQMRGYSYPPHTDVLGSPVELSPGHYYQ